MPESQIHMDMVKIVFNYVSSLLPEVDRSSIQVDTPYSFSKPPRIIGNFQPDVYYIDTKKMIIGEAKTDIDAEKKHSVEQYLSYLHEGNMFKGNVTIVLGVFFYGYDSLVNLFRVLKRREKFVGKIILLDSTGRKMEI